MVEAGVIDAAKVTRSALENAASIAAMILTTEALITDIPEKERARPRRCLSTRRLPVHASPHWMARLPRRPAGVVRMWYQPGRDQVMLVVARWSWAQG